MRVSLSFDTTKERFRNSTGIEPKRMFFFKLGTYVGNCKITGTVSFFPPCTSVNALTKFLSFSSLSVPVRSILL